MSLVFIFRNLAIFILAALATALIGILVDLSVFSSRYLRSQRQKEAALKQALESPPGLFRLLVANIAGNAAVEMSQDPLKYKEYFDIRGWECHWSLGRGADALIFFTLPAMLNVIGKKFRNLSQNKELFDFVPDEKFRRALEIVLTADPRIKTSLQDIPAASD
ncbi:hypothetical protein N7481_013121 [Penicillium waksmanii]|uniref:uncharacterized protein n=1 Tax=Penicillium waksmanii TaxID=69791 RepID=UPI0025483392|nr:uncharacterized protein N7481_013121 [Penicillium waksmanii]KAJ5966407.1 hypothetical protein N7481_013121 [Penicillium waksmanii]